MIVNNEIKSLYFDWLCKIINDGIGSRNTLDYTKLLSYLYDTTFYYLIEMDSNRAGDGIYLRCRFASEHNIDNWTLYFKGEECSVLEMMVALAVRMEDSIMYDSDIGNRTPKWFWMMIKNLGLIHSNDYSFDYEYVKNVINNFLNRNYDSDGSGGLFTIKNYDKDLRDIEIWYQMQAYCMYLDIL